MTALSFPEWGTIVWFTIGFVLMWVSLPQALALFIDWLDVLFELAASVWMAG